MKEKITAVVNDVLKELRLEQVAFTVEHPAELSHGDYACNVAMILGGNPREHAEKITSEIEGKIDGVEKVEIAGPGFINFTLKRDFFAESLGTIEKAGDTFGSNESRLSEKVMVEYTDPNPFKQIHIGHLMSNAVGESIARTIEAQGAEVKRANYQGDVGMHVAKAVWGMQQLSGEMPSEDDSLRKKVSFLGKAYAHGAKSFEENEGIATEIKQVNVHIYKKTDEEINNLYNLGRAWSLEHFEIIYKTLGTEFDFYFFESEVYEKGSELVKEHLGSVFEESEGAIIFKGEDYGLHTRVFLNSQGLPTYEAKELGLHAKKKESWDFDQSVVITANEQKGVFEVGLKAFEQIDELAAQSVAHVTHGMMLGPGGKKMSSRTGDVISAEEIIEQASAKVREKMEGRELTDDEKLVISEQVAIAALKYAILKQAPGRDIVFDFDQALSLEGDSGPYLQYTAVRANAVLSRAHEAGIGMGTEHAPEKPFELEKLLYRFPEVVARSGELLEPHHITNYLIEIAQSFNAFYAQEKIADPNDEFARYKVALTQATRIVLENGLNILGIKVPEKM